MANQSIADLTLARINVVVAKLDAMHETQRDHTARLHAIEARLGSIESRMDIWNERLARLEVRSGLVEP